MLVLNRIRVLGITGRLHTPPPNFSGSSPGIYCSFLLQVSQETTIGNSNPDLWKYVVERGIVLEWIRSIVANRLARTTVEWGYYFSQHNSGT